jgi:argininosuccinate lyase
VAELVRGKTGGVIGQLVALLTTMKGLPLSYNRDLQEDKTPLFEAVDTLSICLEIYSQMLPHISVNAGRMQSAAASGYQNATDLADYLVSRGMPFREAHHCAGRAVRHAIDLGKELDQLALETLQGFSELIRKDVYRWLSVEQVVDRRMSAGGTGKAAVQTAIAAAETELAREESETA